MDPVPPPVKQLSNENINQSSAPMNNNPTVSNSQSPATNIGNANKNPTMQ